MTRNEYFQKMQGTADALFDNPEAGLLWAKMQTGGIGGMEEAAKLLGMEREYDGYCKGFLMLFDQGQNQEAIRLQDRVIERLSALLLERFGKIQP